MYYAVARVILFSARLCDTVETHLRLSGRLSPEIAVFCLSLKALLYEF